MEDSKPKIKALKELAKIMAKLELDKISGYKKEPAAADEEESEDPLDAGLGEDDEEDPVMKKVLEARAKKLV